MQKLLEPVKEKTKTYRCAIVSTAVSPITHMSGVEGNEAVVMREPVVYGGDVRWVPVITGNALRHRMLRATGFRHLVDAWELRGKLSLAQLNFLFHGGNLTQSNGQTSLARTNDVYRLFPLLRALGCSLPDQILPGNLNCHRGILACRENASRLPQPWSDRPVDWESLPPAQSLVEGYQYTRNDATNTVADLLPEADRDSLAESNMMIFSGQSVIAGAVFVHGFTFRHATTVELGAVIVALREWVASGATIGGMASKGHGRLSPRFDFGDGVDQGAAVEAYEQRLCDRRDEGIALLNDLFAAKKEKPAKAKRVSKTKGGGDDDEAA